MTSKQLTIKIRYNKILGIERSVELNKLGHDMTRRATGLSTGQALEFIGAAMQRPNVKLTVPKDHFNNSITLQVMLADMIMDNVAKLGLVGFERVSRDVIMYSPVGEVDAVVQL